MSAKQKGYAETLSSMLARRSSDVRETGKWHQRILEGLRFESVENIKAHAALTDAELARLLGIGEATLQATQKPPLAPIALLVILCVVELVLVEVLLEVLLGLVVDQVVVSHLVLGTGRGGTVRAVAGGS